MRYLKYREVVAKEIAEAGAMRFGSFPLKHQEGRPELPNSPFKFFFKKPPQGPLHDELVEKLGWLLWRVANDANLVYDSAIGVPTSGNPFASVVAGIERVSQHYLEKVEQNGCRRIIGLPGQNIRGRRILLVDDLITWATSKLEAISAVRSLGGRVVGTVVLLDREQGGREVLGDRTVLAVWQLGELLDFYRQEGLISQERYEEATTYVRSQRAPAQYSAF